MTYSLATRPEADEYAPYYGKYVNLVPEGDLLDTLSKQLHSTLALLGSISESQADWRYAPDKWSIKEVVGHIIDTERIFAYRALRFSRNDPQPIPGYEPDDYLRFSSFGSYPLSELAEEFNLVRQSNLYLFRHLDDSAWLRRGVASDNEVSVRALAYIIAGHELHHLEVLRTRYL